MTDVTIRRQDSAEGGRYVATLPGTEGEAELTYTRPAPGIVSANHTGVPDAMGGQGVGKALVRALVDDAEAEGFRILPRCPFVARQASEHPDRADIFTTAQR